MGINKVVYGNDTLIDISEDTVTEEDVVYGVSFHKADGIQREGTITNYRGEYIECDGFFNKENNLIYMAIKNDWGILDFLNAVVDLSSRFYCSIYDIISDLGNAKPSDVKKGVIFTSNQGINLVGTYEEVAPEYAYASNTFTISASGGTVTINCGFKPDKIIIYRALTNTPNVVCLYDKDISTTQFYQNSGSTNRWLNLQSAVAAIVSVSDSGFDFRGYNSANVQYKYIAIKGNPNMPKSRIPEVIER